jgi:hypothetical protein
VAEAGEVSTVVGSEAVDSTEEDLEAHTSVAAEAFTPVALLSEDSTAAASALLEESAILLARGRHTGSQSM